MRDFLRCFESKAKFRRRQFVPIVDRLGRWDPMKSVIDFRGVQSLGVKRQHLRRRQILRIKISFPFGVLKTGRANPRLHAIAPSTINNLSFSFAKVVPPACEILWCLLRRYYCLAQFPSAKLHRQKRRDGKNIARDVSCTHASISGWSKSRLEQITHLFQVG